MNGQKDLTKRYALVEREREREEKEKERGERMTGGRSCCTLHVHALRMSWDLLPKEIYLNMGTCVQYMTRV